MKRNIRIHSQEKEQAQTGHLQEETTKATPHEFATPEEMLRHDSLHTPVPPRLASRIQESINRAPATPRSSWWKRMLGLGQ